MNFTNPTTITFVIYILAMIGIGFAAWSGGALQFINQYGLNDFIARARYLAEEYGERFSPPALLLEKAAKGALF